MALRESFERQGNFLFRYRGLIPLAFIGLAFLAQASNVFGMDKPDRQLDDPYILVCMTVSLAGLLVRILTVGYTPANTSGRNTEGQLADELNITGIYSTVRHPLYLGNFLLWLGVAMLTRNGWFCGMFVFLYWVYYERIMYAEEQFLRGKFGETFDRWSSSTPAFIPSFRLYTRPGLSFSLKKVLKKEKNTVAQLLLVFYLFTYTDGLWAGQYAPETGWLFWAALAGIFVYLILKALKHLTVVLDEPGR